jgi:Uma2 family endonuclease
MGNAEPKTGKKLPELPVGAALKGMGGALGMVEVQIPLQERVKFTYQDYLNLPDDGKTYQIINGELFMAPAPSPYHQRVSLQITIRLSEFVSRNQLGRIFYAPCDVVLSEEDIVQPDLFFICRERYYIIGDRYISEAPDLVVEILSPTTERLDRFSKRDLYERYGVKELWMVDPMRKEIEVLSLHGGRFEFHGRFGEDDVLSSPLLEGLSFKVREIF